MALLSDSDLETRLAAAPAWRREDGTIVRDYSLENFEAAIQFVDRVAAVAEVKNHHPDILVHGWNKVRLTLSTHSEGGLTDAGFELAALIDQLD